LDSILVGCGAASLCDWNPKLRGNVVSSSSRFKMSNKNGILNVQVVFKNSEFFKEPVLNNL
jgi:hypothetical protein